jgi:hypothetical protein
MSLPILLMQASMLSLFAMTGNELCVAAFLEPVLRASRQDVQLAVAPRAAARLGRAMPFWYALSLLLTAGNWWFNRAVPVAVSALLQLLIVVATIAFLVPINNRVARGELGEDMRNARRWDTLHRARVVLLLIASALLLV